ncbi:MAG TPA: c-type cytochrome [Azospirillum sp.]|nr:c-type cytochrome [Azospirillum sp.]
MRAVWTALSLAAFLFAAAPATAASDSDKNIGDLGAVARGGRLYDDWLKELGGEPARLRKKNAERPQRCVACHGWDYGGANGVKGLRGMAGGDPAAVMAVLVDDTHRYTDVLDRSDFNDLAMFVTRGQIDMAGLIDPKTLSVRGDAAKGVPFFQTVCANCHGNDGQQISDASPLGDLARGNPWQALHTLLNGHPSGNMPSLRALDITILLDTLATLQTLPSRHPMAAIARGGRLYDTWYKENHREAPAGIHPAYPIALADGVQARTTWRCKECHGWDYRGKDGAYGPADDGSEGHNTGIVGIRGMAGRDPAAVIAVLGDDRHRYAGLLSVRDMADLAVFVTQGQVDMDRYIDRYTKAVRGDAQGYAQHYQTICATCHGPDGRQIRTMPPLGRIARDDPWRALHGMLNGHPGEAMPPLRSLPEETAAGILAHAQTLPIRK